MVTNQAIKYTLKRRGSRTEPELEGFKKLKLKLNFIDRERRVVRDRQHDTELRATTIIATIMESLALIILNVIWQIKKVKRNNNDAVSIISSSET